MRNQRLEGACEIVDKLQDWIDEVGNFGELYAGLSYSANDVLSIEIGQFGLWCCQTDSSDDFTFEYCRDSFLKQIEQFAPFLEIEAGS